MNGLHVQDADMELIGMALQEFLDSNNAKLSNRSLFGVCDAEAAVRTEWVNRSQQLLEDVSGGTE